MTRIYESSIGAAISRGFGRVASLGIDETTLRSDIKHIQLLNISVLSYIAYSFVNLQIPFWSWITGKFGNWPAWFVFFATLPFIVSLAILLLSAKRRHDHARSLFIVMWLLNIAIAALLNGPQINAVVMQSGVLPILFFLFPASEAARRNIFLIVDIVIYLTLYIALNGSPLIRFLNNLDSRPPNLPTVAQYEAQQAGVNWIYLLVMIGLLFLLSLWLFRIVNRAEAELDAERMKSDALLHRVLPSSIATRLKANGISAVSQRVADASVLFADIVGFTSFSEQTEPEIVVETLNEMYSEFDRLVTKHRLEKIKMIGDAYMVAGGVPDERPGHREAIVNLAFDMIAAVRDDCEKFGGLRLRIGIHAGPLVAGVIGDTRFLFDLWGDRFEKESISGSSKSVSRFSRVGLCHFTVT